MGVCDVLYVCKSLCVGTGAEDNFGCQSSSFILVETGSLFFTAVYSKVADPQASRHSAVSTYHHHLVTQTQVTGLM